jgi:hypothetical protein
LSSAAARTWYINTHNEILLLPSDENENPRAPNACTRRTIKFYSCRPAVAAAVVRILWRERLCHYHALPTKLETFIAVCERGAQLCYYYSFAYMVERNKTLTAEAEYSRACVIALLRIHLHL